MINDKIHLLKSNNNTNINGKINATIIFKGIFSDYLIIYYYIFDIND